MVAASFILIFLAFWLGVFAREFISLAEKQLLNERAIHGFITTARVDPIGAVESKTLMIVSFGLFIVLKPCKN